MRPNTDPWTAWPADFSPTWRALQAASLAVELAGRGDVVGATGRIDEASRSIGPDSPALAVDAVAQARAYLDEVSPNAKALAGAAAAADAGYVATNVVLSKAERERLERDNALTNRVAEVAASGGNADVAYGLGIAGEKVADVGSSVGSALATALTGWTGPLALAGALLAAAVGLWFVARKAVTS